MAKVSQLIAGVYAFILIANTIWAHGALALKAGYEDLHVYDYKAQISVGVEEPAEYISKFWLHGVIRVQRDVSQLAVSEYKYLIALTDAKYDTYYGEDAIRISKFEPVVDERLLGASFTAVYQTSGRLKSVEFHKNEAKWAKKIKKSIASLLQFEWSPAQRDLKKEGQMHFVPVEETTTHGNCFVSYNTTLIKKISKTSKKMNLVKTVHPTKCSKFAPDVNGFEINDKATLKSIKDRLDHKKTKIESIYELDIIKNQPIVKKLFNFEKYRFDFNTTEYLFSHNPMFVKIRQTLFLKKTEPGDEFLHSSKNITPAKQSQSMTINQEQVISKVKELLLEVKQYVNENHLVEIVPGTEHRQLFNKIHHNLEYLDDNGYEAMYNEIGDMKIPEAEMLRNIFVQIIPYVDSESSFSFMKKIILRKQVSDDEANTLLNLFATHLKYAGQKLSEVEIFLEKNNGLSPAVQQTAAKSFAKLLSQICRNTKKSDHASMEKYIQNINALMEDATAMDVKLSYLTALGNTQCHGAVKYIKSLIPRQNNDSKDKLRLRMTAMMVISRLIEADDTDVLDVLAKIVHDRSEVKELRLRAYKVLVDKSDFDTEDLIELGRSISTNEYLHNYHVTTMKNLHQIGILTANSLSKIITKSESLSPLKLTNIVFELNDSLDLRLIKQYFQLNLSKKSRARILMVGDFNFSSISLASAPTLMEFEMFDVVNGEIIVKQAMYFHSNLDSWKDDTVKNFEGIFLDASDLRNNQFTLDSFDISELYLSISDFDFKAILKYVTGILVNPWFEYSDLQVISIPTGFGIDVVYQNKQPTFAHLNISYDWPVTKDSAEIRIKISYENWLNGYSDISFVNPLSQLTHSTRKTRIGDSLGVAAIFIKYDFSKQTCQIIIPLRSKNSQPIMMYGASTYVSSSVAISNRDGETSCHNCGHRNTKKSDTIKLTHKRDEFIFETIGLSNKAITYDCDIPSMSPDDQRNPSTVASTCGKLFLMETEKSVSQIEFNVDIDVNELLSTSNPWYFLPGFDFNMDTSLGIRKLDGDFTALVKQSLILTSSQGNFLAEGRFRHTTKLDENENFNFCMDGKVTFPRISDTHLPSKVTNLKLIADMRLILGKSKDEFCEGLDFTNDVRFTGEMPQEYVNKLKQRSRNSECAKQMKNSSFLYPAGSYLMTRSCIDEIISSTSIRRLRLDIKNDKIPTDSVLKIYQLIENLRMMLKEKFLKWTETDVDVKLLSQLSDIMSNKTISYQVDVLNHYNVKFAPNFYFSQGFVYDFVAGHMNVINVYPKLVLFDNTERKDLTDSLGDWTLITYSDIDPVYKLYVKLLKDGKLTVRLLHDNEKLHLEPSTKKGDSISNFAPRVFYNGYIDDFSERTFLRSSEDVLFSLLKVDGYLVVRLTTIPMIIYYFDSSVTILKGLFMD